MLLNDCSFATFKAFLSIGALMATSVVRNPSIVAMLGAIIPEPLAIPPKLTLCPFKLISTQISFTFRSVVKIAFAAKCEPFLANPLTKFFAAPLILL